MRTTIISLVVLVAIVLGLAWWQGPETFRLGLRTSGSQLVRFLPILVIAITLAGFGEVLLPQVVVERWLSDASGWRGIAIAWVAGALTPGGSIMGFPFVAALYQAGAGVGVLITYLTSLAMLSVVRIPIEVSFYGGRLTLLRIAAALILPPVAGLIARVLAPLFLPATIGS